MRTASKVLAIALLAIFLASIEVKAIVEVARGHGSDVSLVNVYGFALTWIEGAPLVAVPAARARQRLEKFGRSWEFTNARDRSGSEGGRFPAKPGISPADVNGPRGLAA
jgi:hypothetical protein